MIIDCICGKKKFRLSDELMPSEGSKVRCGSCSEVWFYHPNQGSSPVSEESTNNFEEQIQNTTETPPVESISEEDPDELLSTIDESEVAEEAAKQDNQDLTGFKIFTEEDSDLPSKEEMDKNLDNFRIERDKNLNFFQRLFKKDRMHEAAQALEKKKLEEYSEEDEKANVARRTRLLFYLLILLTIVFSVIIVPLREDVGMAFPFLKGYLDFLVPVYEYIKVPLKL